MEFNDGDTTLRIRTHLEENEKELETGCKDKKLRIMSDKTNMLKLPRAENKEIREKRDKRCKVRSIAQQTVQVDHYDEKLALGCNSENDLEHVEEISGSYEISGVYLPEDVVMPPRSKVIYPAKLRNPRNISSLTMVIEPHEGITSGIWIARSVCKTQQIVPLNIINITDKNILIPRKQIIAQAYGAECQEEENGGNPRTKWIRSITNQQGTEEILTQLHLKNPEGEKEKKLANLIKEYIDIFRAPNQRLTCTDKVKHRIITEDVPPINKRPYRVPYQRRAILNKEIQDLLDNEIIVESQSPWSFPAILLEKRRHPGEEPQFRLCIDYRELNAITKTDFFPLPHL